MICLKIGTHFKNFKGSHLKIGMAKITNALG